MITDKLKEHASMIAGATVASMAVAMIVRREQQARRSKPSLVASINHPLPDAELYDYVPFAGDEELLQKPESSLTRIQRKVGTVGQRIEKVTRKSPLVSGAVLAAAGFGIGMALPQGRQEQVYVAKALQRAKKYGSQLLHEGLKEFKATLNNPMADKILDLIGDKIN